jgi:2,3-bisphosphoglycerate-independent phosphoglycerate mutase
MPKNIKVNKQALPLVLVVLDGWGLNPNKKGNAIAKAKTLVMDDLVKNYSNMKLEASSTHVGLPKGQAGNSEAGHMNIGAGRAIEQDVVIISKSISNGTFFKNPAFLQATHHVSQNKSDIHLMGLLSDGSSPHSDDDHLLSLLSFFMTTTQQKIYLHLFTDGRDSPKFAALKILGQYKNIFDSKRVQIATIMGRFYSMDRKKSWKRTKLAYEALVAGKGHAIATGLDGVSQAYNRGESDEFITPSVIVKDGKPVGPIGDKDAVIFFNLRSDRARQLAKAFTQVDFEKKNGVTFKREKVIKNLLFVALTDFGPDLDNILTAYPGIDVPDTLPMALQGLRQEYIAETEKYAHVTYFFNGGYAHTVAGEKRVDIPSKDVDSYDEVPEMSTPETVDYIVKRIKQNKLDFATVNFAAPDMMGHTGNIKAAVRAVEAVDSALGQVVEAVREKRGTVVVVADHGNADEMLNEETGEVITQHSAHPVPFILVSDKKYNLVKKGGLSRVAPTILEILNIDKSKLMTAKSLIKK